MDFSIVKVTVRDRPFGLGQTTVSVDSFNLLSIASFPLLSKPAEKLPELG